MNDNRTILLKYNIDTNGVPTTVKIDKESNQISPLNNTIQLEQVPSEQNNIVVIDDVGNEMYEVDHLEDVTENSYHVNYHSGLVHFHPSKAGKTNVFSYYGVGYELIGASRVYDEHAFLGKYIFETLQELIDRGRECIDALNTIGNAIELLRRIENYIVVATELDIKLREDIATGDALHITLTNDIEIGSVLKDELEIVIENANESKADLEATTTNANNKKVELEGVISTANTSKTNLENATATADAKKTELDTSIANAQDDINTINAKGNDSYIVLSTNWVGTEPNLTYTLNHGLNSKNLIVGAINDDTKFSSMPDFKYIDMNTIELQSATRINITVSINANYYSGKDANTVAQEVIDARDGEISLKGKIDDINTSINALNTEIITARGSDLTLDERLDGIDLDINAMSNIVFNIETFRLTGYTDTETLNNALAVVPNGSIIRFDCNRIYSLQSISKITKAITLDFNGATISIETTGDLFTIGLVGENGQRISFINFNFINKIGVIPNCVFKIDDGINTLINGKFTNVKAIHSLVWNYKGYGTKIYGEMRWSNCPRCVYLSNNGAEIHSYAIEINCDITGNTGIGVEIEGGNGSIGGVIESCMTGIRFNGISIISALNIRTYFENNTEQDILLNDTTGSQCTIFLNSSFFTRSTLASKKAIVLGRRCYITSVGNFFNHCGVYETEVGVSGASLYTGINNAFISGGNADFSVNLCEISDGIYNVINKSLTNGGITTQKQMDIVGTNTKTQYKSNSIVSQGVYGIYSNGGANGFMFDGNLGTVYPSTNGTYSLGKKDNNFKDIWANNIMYLPTHITGNRPLAEKGGAIIFDVTLSKPLYWYVDGWYTFDTNTKV